MKIQVQLYLPDQSRGTVWGYGTITFFAEIRGITNRDSPQSGGFQRFDQ